VAADRTTAVVDAGGDHLGPLGCAHRQPGPGVATGHRRAGAIAAEQRGSDQYRFLRQRVTPAWSELHSAAHPARHGVCGLWATQPLTFPVFPMLFRLWRSLCLNTPPPAGTLRQRWRWKTPPTINSASPPVRNTCTTNWASRRKRRNPPTG